MQIVHYAFVAVGFWRKFRFEFDLDFQNSAHASSLWSAQDLQQIPFGHFDEIQNFFEEIISAVLHTKQLVIHILGFPMLTSVNISQSITHFGTQWTIGLFQSYFYSRQCRDRIVVLGAANQVSGRIATSLAPLPPPHMEDTIVLLFFNYLSYWSNAL